MIDGATFIDLLRTVWDAGDIEMSVRPYSGRGMYGKECVGVEVDDIFTLALALGDANNGNIDLFQLGTPRSDSMGLGTIYYWPRLEWPEGVEGFSE